MRQVWFSLTHRLRTGGKHGGAGGAGGKGVCLWGGCLKASKLMVACPIKKEKKRGKKRKKEKSEKKN